MIKNSFKSKEEFFIKKIDFGIANEVYKIILKKKK